MLLRGTVIIELWVKHSVIKQLILEEYRNTYTAHMTGVGVGEAGIEGEANLNKDNLLVHL